MATNSSNKSTRGPSSVYILFVSFVAALGGFLLGYDLVIISGAQLFIKKYFHLSAAELGFATSSAILGCIAGPTFGAYLCDHLGRKKALMTSALLLAVGTIWTALPGSIGMFNIFRIIGGFGVGIASIASPMYIAETAPARLRGRLGLMYQFAITAGAASATLVAWLLAKTLPDQISWRWMFASAIVPVTAFMVLLTRIPQSPRWLAEKGYDSEALRVFAKINGADAAQAELARVKAHTCTEQGSFAGLFRPEIRTVLFIAVMLALFNNWTGWSGVCYYLPAIFQMGGYTKASDAIGISLIPTVANVFLILIAIWLVDRAGRRPLWLYTSAAMIISLGVMGLVFFLHLKGPIVVVAMLCVLAPHAIGLGPLPWLMMSEVFPNHIRARAVSVSTTCLWVAGFTGSLAFPKLAEISQRSIGSPAGIFWIYAVICILALLFGLKFLPETKARNLEDITGPN